MARLSRKEIDEIVKRDMPGHRVTRRAPAQDALRTGVHPDEGTPDLAALRRKYLGDGDDVDEHAADEGRAVAGPDAIPEDDDLEDEMVTLEPTVRTDPSDRGSRGKTVVISGRDKRIIASQG